MKIRTYLSINSILLSGVVFLLGFNFYTDNRNKEINLRAYDQCNSSTQATLEGMGYEIDSINARIRRINGEEN